MTKKRAFVKDKNQDENHAKLIEVDSDPRFKKSA